MKARLSSRAFSERPNRRISSALWLSLWFGVVGTLLGGEDTSVVVETEVTGLLSTNCYLFYDPTTGDAALIDPGGPVEKLLATIAREGLRLRYIFTTHGHPDHVAGIPAVMKSHPGAKLAMSQREYDDGSTLYAQWETVFPAATVERIRSTPESLALFNFPYASLGTPAVILRDGATIMLGTLPITVISTPGHSRGGVCLCVRDRLFSGDTLLHGRIGSTQLPGSSRQTLVESVQRLLARLPESTLVLPGHREPTNIGKEKAAGTGRQ